MALVTTVIGSFPKPPFLNVPDWFKSSAGANSDQATLQYTSKMGQLSCEQKGDLERDFMRATEEVIGIQFECGVQIVTDGEVRRENYIHYLCRFIDGIDFESLTETSCRNGAYNTSLPTIRGKVSWRGTFHIVEEWQKAQEVTSATVKYTVPGPMTMIGTLNNAFYEDEQELASDLAHIINAVIVSLTKAGCKHIQLDEPVFARRPEKALEWGIRMMTKCFEGVDDNIHKSLHVCCGYPEYLDQEGYIKADPSSYFKLATALDESGIDSLSIEDAHRRNDLTLLDKFKRIKVILGVVKTASSEVESVEEISDRLEEALKHVESDRLMIAPDCGLGFLPEPILKKKLFNMCAAATMCRCKTAGKKRRIAISDSTNLEQPCPSTD